MQKLKKSLELFKKRKYYNDIEIIVRNKDFIYFENKKLPYTYKYDRKHNIALLHLN